jgi:hypothetical protein
MVQNGMSSSDQKTLALRVYMTRTWARQETETFFITSITGQDLVAPVARVTEQTSHILSDELLINQILSAGIAGKLHNDIELIFTAVFTII